MVTEQKAYKCDKCGKKFFDLEMAEEHEKIQIRALPKGFVFYEDFPEDLGYRLFKTILGENHLNSNHDTFYNTLVIHLGDPSARPKFSNSLQSADFVTKDLKIGAYRLVTDEELEMLQSHPAIKEKLTNHGIEELVRTLE